MHSAKLHVDVQHSLRCDDFYIIAESSAISDPKPTDDS